MGKPKSVVSYGTTLLFLFVVLGSTEKAFTEEKTFDYARFLEIANKSTNEELRRKAEQGDADAQFDLGLKYENGESVSRDSAEAVRWFRRAAEQGHARAQFNLARALQVAATFAWDGDEEGVTKGNDDAEIEHWFRRAAEQGYANAQFIFEYLYSEEGVLTEDNLDEFAGLYWAYDNIFRAEQGDASAQFHLSNMYYKGEGVSRNGAEAAIWLRRAAEQEHAGAQNNLGSRYAHGEGVPTDYAEAARWFRLAAKQGNARAQLNLGIAYLTGRGVPMDYVEAVRWYRRSAEQGNADAQTALGIAYSIGHGVPEDYVEAYAWFNLAAAQGSEDAKKFRGDLRGRMTANQIAEAQKLSTELFTRIEDAANDD